MHLYFLQILCSYHRIDVEIVEQTKLYYYLSRAHGTLGLGTSVSTVYCSYYLMIGSLEPGPAINGGKQFIFSTPTLI